MTIPHRKGAQCRPWQHVTNKCTATCLLNDNPEQEMGSVSALAIQHRKGAQCRPWQSSTGKGLSVAPGNPAQERGSVSALAMQHTKDAQCGPWQHITNKCTATCLAAPSEYVDHSVTKRNRHQIQQAVNRITVRGDKLKTSVYARACARIANFIKLKIKS